MEKLKNNILGLKCLRLLMTQAFISLYRRLKFDGRIKVVLVFRRQVREQDTSVDSTCLNGECRNIRAGECFCVGFRSSIGDEADFSGCRGCMNGRIGKIVREMEFHGTVDGFCHQGLGTGSLEEDFAVDTV